MPHHAACQKIIEATYRLAPRHVERLCAEMLPLGGDPPPAVLGAALVVLFSMDAVVQAPSGVAVDPMSLVALQGNMVRTARFRAAVEALKFLQAYDPAALAALPDQGRDFEEEATRAVESLAKRATDPSAASSPLVAKPWAQVLSIVQVLHTAVARMQLDLLELRPVLHVHYSADPVPETLPAGTAVH